MPAREVLNLADQFAHVATLESVGNVIDLLRSAAHILGSLRDFTLKAVGCRTHDLRNASHLLRAGFLLLLDRAKQLFAGAGGHTLGGFSQPGGALLDIACRSAGEIGGAILEVAAGALLVHSG